jgi:hypothetical protein
VASDARDPLEQRPAPGRSASARSTILADEQERVVGQVRGVEQVDKVA